MPSSDERGAYWLTPEWREKVSRRRAMVDEWLNVGWSKTKIAETLWLHHRELVPSESLEQVVMLIGKDIAAIYSEIAEARVSKLPEVARNLHAARWKRAYEENMKVYRDTSASEQFRAASMKMAMTALEKWGLLEGVDPARIAARLSAGANASHESWEVEVGEGGLATAKQIEGKPGDDLVDTGVVIDTTAREVEN
jgi:hypothetical protein